MIQDFYKKVNNLVQILHSIGIMHIEQVEHFRKCNLKVKIPEILSEIFEIESGTKNTLMNVEAVKNLMIATNPPLINKKKLASKLDKPVSN